ncbi:MAG: hypothetical protein RSB96_02545, partial [Oscillospiraceae bacterium]
YIFALANNMMATMMEQGIFDVKQLLKTESEGIKTEEKVVLEAQKRVNEYFSINEKIKEFGYTFTEEEQERIDSTVKSAMELKEFYTENGISDESIKEYYTTQHKKTLLFKNYYNAETGAEPVSNEQLKAYGVENYIRTKYILFKKQDQEGNTITDEGVLANLKQKAEGYLQRVKKGEAFEPLIHELELEAQFNAANEYTLEYKGEKEQATEPVEQEKKPFVPSEYTDESGYTHTHPDATLHTIKVDEYDVIAQKTDTSDPVKTSFISLVKDLPVGQLTLVEDENAFYIVKNIEFDKEFMENLSLNFIFDMKSEEFDQLLQTWASEMQITFNPNTKKAFTPNKINFS